MRASHSPSWSRWWWKQATIVVAGVDTHKDTHHVAVLDLVGKVIADQKFTADAAGYRAAEVFIAEHGLIDRVGIELTGSYGAGLTRPWLRPALMSWRSTLSISPRGPGAARTPAPTR